MKRSHITSMAAAVAVAVAAVAAGCKEEPKPAANPPAAPAAAPAKPGAPATQPKADDHPNAVSLGTQTAGGLTFSAMQDEPVKAGDECAFDLKIMGAAAKPKAVRFWVGVESAEGSTKAKASEEKDEADTWHSHVDVPKPLPAGSKFWAEVEPATGDKVTVSFTLK